MPSGVHNGRRDAKARRHSAARKRSRGGGDKHQRGADIPDEFFAALAGFLAMQSSLTDGDLAGTMGPGKLQAWASNPELADNLFVQILQQMSENTLRTSVLPRVREFVSNGKSWEDLASKREKCVRPSKIRRAAGSLVGEPMDKWQPSDNRS